jgi:hypothetical protein
MVRVILLCRIKLPERSAVKPSQAWWSEAKPSKAGKAKQSKAKPSPAQHSAAKQA